MPLRIIINADDLGISDSVNDSIFKLLERQAVSSATVMANAPAIEAAVRDAKRFGKDVFGVHLNATEFEPLTDGAGLRPLLNVDGAFSGDIRAMTLDARTREAIANEWSAQINRVRQLGLQISHLDSHHHIHTIPSLFPVLKEVQKRFGIRRVRATMNCYPVGQQPRGTLLIKKWLWTTALKSIYPTKTTRWMMPFSVFHSRLNEFSCRDTTVELMAHPGHEDFASETAMLDTGWIQQLPSGTRLIAYPDL